MSTIRTNTLSNVAGTASTAIENAINGSAKAWVNFNGTGTVAIRASFNVTSITDNGTGDYSVNFTNAMTDANYAAAGFAQAGGGYALRLSNVTQPSTSAIRFSTLDPGVAVSDSATVYVTIFR